jgi:hypothetical protein
LSAHARLRHAAVAFGADHSSAKLTTQATTSDFMGRLNRFEWE